MRIIFHPNAWADYLYWQKQDRKKLKKINSLIKEIQGCPFDGIGKPEALKFDLSGFWSRRIDKVNRLIYRIEDADLHILSCKYHY